MFILYVPIALTRDVIDVNLVLVEQLGGRTQILYLLPSTKKFLTVFSVTEFQIWFSLFLQVGAISSPPNFIFDLLKTLVHQGHKRKHVN